MTSHTTPLEYKSHQSQMNILGFWVFLGAEIVLFATLFASYFVLEHNTAGGPGGGADIFVLKDVLIETFLLLTSSFTSGLAIHAMRNHDKKGLLLWMIATLLLGAGFLFMEINEFLHFIHEGATIQTSGFTAGLFTLLGTHGAHVTFGIIWISLLLVQLVRRGITEKTSSKLFIASLYWHFLDVVWIFIFTFVYLKGMVM
ncbi:AA3-600 quinol oxidase subunit IIII [Gracilibacillus boraciitolerans JCM 21714]|uniref:Quinol oxidase subunit 3 n=1 Tax=Gracilibacillus boraciitolerans JCM 21714 TaxID=1298598 RepID=W4VMJ2_9BACI|nr:cytochrome aa3 quinol oxidase subunit III [Gracilibacillus boraciitolerans]GAE94630.1 AA3-600 quinol oxidase subunit IIII [Gracilibacillus boraciitolerans JCM 21714]